MPPKLRKMTALSKENRKLLTTELAQQFVECASGRFGRIWKGFNIEDKTYKHLCKFCLWILK